MVAPRRGLGVLALLAALGAGCAGGEAERRPERGTGEGAAAAPTPSEAARADGGEASEKIGPTGIVSEDAFIRLHMLSDAPTPPPRGEAVEVAGARAYLSLPEGVSAPRPAVIVIHEWWGLNDHIRRWTDRLAAAGYAALAVDLYGGREASGPEEAMALMKAVDPDRALAILAAARRFLSDDPRVKAPRVGVVGWCFGGGWSLQAGLNVKGLDAVVMYYGRPVLDPAKLEALPPLLAIFGNLDPSFPPELVDRFDRALTEAGVDHTILRYDAMHAFANPSSARYDRRAAADAWKHVQAFLADHLRGE